ncbi:coproporphyrinogen III oxidase family protein [Sulfurospirillum arcachonense]|uniref:coproporphyrinogen III oxidase family protein n=1 Tax=Sulfurospirillum arcachonense TaxID=57666 RepID=UPI0004B474F3|nr:coproporphyrinogen III oxidase family protein [Sulfurospirillum arcachonense]
MKKIIETASLFSSAEAIRKSMASNLDLGYTTSPTKHIFDKNKSYFLYIHVPFCHEFCTFCTFHKFKYNESTCKEYFANVRLELLKAKEEGFSFDTLYIGGGTPLIDEKELMLTLELAKKLFDIKEVSCESTPNHIDANILTNFKGLIDRLSIGVQTFDNSILKKISRYDKYGSSEILQDKISAVVGIIPIISLDLIFNLDMQNEEMLRHDLHIAKQLDVEQITTYPLMNSKAINQSMLEHFLTLKKSKEFELYNIIREELADYSLNNAWSFSKTKTNISDEYTVTNSEYIGIGSGAFSHINNQLHVNAYDLNQYKELVTNNTNAIIASSKLFTLKKHIQYQFLLYLFGGCVEIKKFNKLFKVNLENILKLEIFMLKRVKAIDIKKGIIYPTRFGEFLIVSMMKEFYMGMDNIRAMLRKSIMTETLN